MDSGLPFYVVGLRFDYPRRKGFLFFFRGRFAFCSVLSFFFKHIIFDRLKYTDRLIASQLPAFMSKIINPQVSNIGTL